MSSPTEGSGNNKLHLAGEVFIGETSNLTIPEMNNITPTYKKPGNRNKKSAPFVSKQKKEEKMLESTAISDFSFSDLVDIPDLQQLVTHLSALAGCPIGILDANNTVLAASNWQKICTCFHRIHPETKIVRAV